MKKVIALLLAIVVACSLGGCALETADLTCGSCGEAVQSEAAFCSSCGAELAEDDAETPEETPSLNEEVSSDSGDKEASTETKPTDSHKHSYGDATCTEAAKCSCGATVGSALGHSYAQGKCTRCGAADPENASVSVSKLNALKKAKSYLDFSAFSYLGLIGQLEYEKFSHEDAVYGADHCGADWNEQALKKAKSYLDFSAFSYSGLIGQLEYEKFTSEQAKYAADRCGANWNDQAAEKAKSYLEFSAFSRQGLIDQLVFEGFTNDQAVYGVNAVGL